MKASFMTWLLLGLAGCAAAQQSEPTLGRYSRYTRTSMDEKIESLLRRMTLEEKIGQLVQVSGDLYGAQNPAEELVSIQKQIELARRGGAGSFLNVTGASKTRRFQEAAVEESRMKIPLLFAMDVIHGFKTMFPIPLAEAASWDTELATANAAHAAREAAANGVHWTFAPMVDIARDARWGRIAEGAGEDPFLGAAFARARVEGFQGTDLTEPRTILACAKHFAAYGAAEGGRDYDTVDVSERTLRDVYLKPFHAAVGAGAGTVMTSFNELSGVPSAANVWLIRDVLRDEWGFEGFVVSDWNAIGELTSHGVAANEMQAAELALRAGVDMDMQSWTYLKHGSALVTKGAIPESLIDESVRKILRQKFRLGLFDDPYRYSKQDWKAITLSGDMMQQARDAVRKSVVLLKNEGSVLPLSKELGSILVVGPFADAAGEMLGPWRARGTGEHVTTLLDGIKAAVSSQTTVRYMEGADLGSRLAPVQALLEQVRSTDVIIAAVGEPRSMSGEAASRSSLNLPGRQPELLEALVKTRKPLVMVLFNGRPLSIVWENDNIPAILEAWLPGSQAGPAIADVLFGDYNPSGKLPVTFPRAAGATPMYYNHKHTGRPGDKADRFTSQYIDQPLQPLYPFGHGLSYTSFEYGAPKLSASGITMKECLKVRVDVKNTGAVAGEEVVQLYVRDVVGSVTRPVKELKGFQKVFLKPAQTTTVSFELRPDDLAFTRLDGSWGAEPGEFRVLVGTSSIHTAQARFVIKE